MDADDSAPKMKHIILDQHSVLSLCDVRLRDAGGNCYMGGAYNHPANPLAKRHVPMRVDICRTLGVEQERIVAEQGTLRSMTRST